MPGQVHVISGPSGVGKSTIIRLIREKVPALGYSISHTSRRPRINEKDGVHYHFVDTKTFKRMIEEGAFVEWAQVYHDLYGTSIASLHSQLEQDLDLLMDLDSQGAKNIRKKIERSILIYIFPPSLAILEKRLRERATDGNDVINIRIKKAIKELNECTWYDYIIINDDLNRSVEEVSAIILSERCRKSRMLPKVAKIVGQGGLL